MQARGLLSSERLLSVTTGTPSLVPGQQLLQELCAVGGGGPAMRGTTVKVLAVAAQACIHTAFSQPRGIDSSAAEPLSCTPDWFSHFLMVQGEPGCGGLNGNGPVGSYICTLSPQLNCWEGL